MRFTPLAITGSAVLLASATFSRGQVPPFYGGGVVAYDPEISVVNSGALLDAQVVVSDDRKYVTITARPSLSRLQALNVFPAAASGTGSGGAGGTGGAGSGAAQLGFVGGAGYIEEEITAAPGTPMPEQSAAAAERAAHANKPAPMPKMPVQSSPSEILKLDTTAANSVLRQEGMFRIETK